MLFLLRFLLHWICLYHFLDVNFLCIVLNFLVLWSIYPRSFLVPFWESSRESYKWGCRCFLLFDEMFVIELGWEKFSRFSDADFSDFFFLHFRIFDVVCFHYSQIHVVLLFYKALKWCFFILLFYSFYCFFLPIFYNEHATFLNAKFCFLYPGHIYIFIVWLRISIFFHLLQQLFIVHVHQVINLLLCDFVNSLFFQNT